MLEHGTVLQFQGNFVHSKMGGEKLSAYAPRVGWESEYLMPGKNSHDLKYIEFGLYL